MAGNASGGLATLFAFSTIEYRHQSFLQYSVTHVTACHESYAEALINLQKIDHES